MKISEIFKNKSASRETNEPEQVEYSGRVGFEPTGVKGSCNCKHTREEIQDSLEGLLPGFSVSDTTKCPECDHFLSDHSSSPNGVNPGECTPDVMTIQRKDSFTISPGAVLKHDGDCACGPIIAAAAKRDGVTGDPDIQTIIGAQGKLESTPVNSEARRDYHHAVASVIDRMMSGGAMPTERINNDQHTIFGSRARALEVGSQIEGTLPSGEDLTMHFDRHRKQGGMSLESVGIDTSELGGTYLRSQQRANEDWSRAVARSTDLNYGGDTLLSNSPNKCGVCESVQDKLDDYFKRLVNSQETIAGNQRRPLREGTQTAYEMWDGFTNGYDGGSRLGSDANDYLKAAEKTMDAWEASGHRSEATHRERPQTEGELGGASITADTTKPFNFFPVEFTKPLRGERWPQFLLDARDTQLGRGDTTRSVSPRNKQLQSVWNDVLKRSGYRGTSEIENAYGIKSPQSHLDIVNSDMFNETLSHLKKNFPELHAAFFKETPVMIKALGPDGNTLTYTEGERKGQPVMKPDPSGRVRATINTGTHLLDFVSGSRDAVGIGEPSRYASVTRRPLPIEQVKGGTYAGNKPYIRPEDLYIIHRGLGIDLTEPITTKINDDNRGSIRCSGRPVDIGGGKIVYEARKPELLGGTTECTDHISHEFDSDGNVTSVTRVPDLSKVKAISTKEKYRAIVNQALSNIFPRLFDEDPRAALNQAGRDHKRFLQGKINLDGSPVGKRSKGSEPSVEEPGGLLPGDTGEVGPGKKDKGGPKKRTRKASVEARPKFNSRMDK